MYEFLLGFSEVFGLGDEARRQNRSSRRVQDYGWAHVKSGSDPLVCDACWHACPQVIDPGLMQTGLGSTPDMLESHWHVHAHMLAMRLAMLAAATKG
jgi:hypothetical protein